MLIFAAKAAVVLYALLTSVNVGTQHAKRNVECFIAPSQPPNRCWDAQHPRPSPLPTATATP